MLGQLSAMRKGLPLPVRMGYGWLKRNLVPHPIWDDAEFKRTYAWLQQTQWWAREQLEAFQLEQLQALVRHAYENVPYYRRVFDTQRLKPADVRRLEDLQKLPLLTREDVRNNREDLVARNIPKESLACVATSGSSGNPLMVYHDSRTAQAREAAFILRQWGWAGYRLGDRIVTLRGNRISRCGKGGQKAWWDYTTDNNELVLSCSDMTEERMYEYVKKIAEFRPRFINAYPSLLGVLASFTMRHHIEDIKVTAAFCESEPLYPYQRQLIEAQFGCKVFCGYGMTERVSDATECERHDGYHVGMEYGILELLDQNNQAIAEPGALGRVVGTGFDTYGMPLIRYVTDDLATYASHGCECGRQSPLVQQFHGRTWEMIVSKSGSLVPCMGLLGGHGVAWGKAQEFRFVQEQPGELIIEIVKAPLFPETLVEREIRDEIRTCVTEQQLGIEVRFVDHILRGPSGKRRVLEQKLSIALGDLPCEFDHPTLLAITQTTESLSSI